ncbi:amidohydrolase [Aquamicrobium sp. LC103]|uniref:amidohydrolase n=1 Tax=Aquamicrobium sp. LC103 TaxID=1120658 RepID=UPI00063E89B9|nr:amidohydrolase [Aquamicrobium sp. LC103]TKT80158.1 amidohydrolase [Aquamicrobium sp. LC103]
MKMRSILLAALMSSAATSAFAQETKSADVDTSAIVAEYSSRMKEVAHKIWEHPELGYLENETSALLQEELKAAGFEVESGVAGIPTAFTAKAGSGDGPVIAILAEMDALPGFSQAATPVKEAVDGIGSGHACGHHLFGAGSVGAAIAIKKWLEETGTPGQIRLYGTPAEEGGSGKVYMVRGGLFSDVDTVLHWHPSDGNSAAQGGTLSNISGKFRFHGKSAHAAMAPDKGRSALDGVEALNFMVNAMREHVPQETRIHYAITNGGAAPNVVPDFAEVYYYVRHPDPAVVADVIARVKKAAEGAALGTETSYEFEVLGGVYSILPNDTLGKAMHESLASVGAPQWSEADMKFAEELQQSLQNKPPLSSAAEIGEYTFGGVGYASTDVGDVSWAAPTVGLGTATWVPGVPAHSWQAVASGGMDIGYKGMDVAAKTLAAMAVRLFSEPALVEQARAEFDKARGEGFEYRPLIGDREPPLDYRVAGE